MAERDKIRNRPQQQVVFDYLETLLNESSESEALNTQAEVVAAQAEELAEDEVTENVDAVVAANTIQPEPEPEPEPELSAEELADQAMIAAAGDEEITETDALSSEEAADRAMIEAAEAVEREQIEAERAEMDADEAMIAAAETEAVNQAGLNDAALADPTLKPSTLADELNCVLIRMHGLNLAVPFDKIEGALHLDALSMKLQNDHDWVIGSFSSAMVSTSVVDTGMLLIPGRYDESEACYEEVLILEGRHWALACDELVKSLRIPSASVNWNTDKSDRPWLLGTYMPERCALIDVDVLLNQFEEMVGLSSTIQL